MSSIGVFAGSLVSVFPGRYKHGVTAVILVGALFHPVITLVLVYLLATTFRSHSATVRGPSAFHLLLRIQFRRHPDAIGLVVRLPVIASVVTLLLMHGLTPPRHSHHATVTPELALHQLLGIAVVIVIDERRARQTLADVVHAVKLVLVDAKVLVNVASPWHRADLTSRR